MLHPYVNVTAPALCSVPGVAFGSCLLGAAIALLPGSGPQQYYTAVLSMTLIKAAAGVGHGWSGTSGHYSSWLVQTSYAAAAITRSQWDAATVAVMHKWAPEICGSIFPYLAAHGWACRKRQLSWWMQLVMLGPLSVLMAYPQWLKHCQPSYTAQCYAHIAIPMLWWMAVFPGLCLVSLPRVLTYMAGSAQIPHHAEATAQRAATACDAGQQPALKQQTAPATARHAEATAQHTAAAGAAGQPPAPKQHNLQTALTAAQALQRLVGDRRSSTGSKAFSSRQQELSRFNAPLYQPAFSPRRPAAVKIRGLLQPQDLPQDMAHQLQAALQPMYQVLQMVTRSGCVCLKLSLLELEGTEGKHAKHARHVSHASSSFTSSSEDLEDDHRPQHAVKPQHIVGPQHTVAAPLAAPSGASVHHYALETVAECVVESEQHASSVVTCQAAAARQLARQLLPVLDTVLTEHQQKSGHDSKPDITFQVGQALWTSHWDGAAASWQLQLTQPDTLPRVTFGFLQQVSCTMPSAKPSNRGMQGFCMPGNEPFALPSDPPSSRAAHGNEPMPGSELSALHPAADSCDAATGNASGSNKNSASPVYNVCLCAQLQVQEGAPPLSTAELASVIGWEQPVLDPGQHEQVDPSAFRLLACCGGSYVSTHVLEVLEPAMEGHHPAVKVELQVPDKLLLRHHVDGPPVGLAPLVLELWQGDTHLSEAPVLLHLPACDSSSTTLGACGPTDHMAYEGSSNASLPCWWWGASDVTVQHAVQELQRSVAVLSAGDASEYAATWQAFQEDLCTWLEQLHLLAVLTGYCTAETGEQYKVQPSTLLDVSQLDTAAAALLKYTQAQDLQHTHRMLQQQRAVLRAWAGRKSPMQRSVMWWAVRDSLCGAPCSQCEAFYRDKLAQLLARAQASFFQLVISAALSSAGSVRVLLSIRTSAYVLSATTGVWALLHLYLLTEQIMTARPSHSSHHSAPCGDSHSSHLTHPSHTQVASQMAANGPSGQAAGPASTVIDKSEAASPIAHLKHGRRRAHVLAAAYAMRHLSHALLGFGVISSGTLHIRPATLVVNYLILTLAEQAQLTPLLSAPLAAALMIQELIIYMMMCSKVGQAGPYLLLALVPVAVLPRLVAHVWVRSKLRRKQAVGVHHN